MSRQNRTTLKGYFNTGARPTQEHFADLIDSNLNLVDDGTLYWGASLGLGHSNPSSTLSVHGNASISPENDSAPSNGLFVHGNVGIGAGFTNPTAQLAVKGSVYIGNSQSTDPEGNSLKVDGHIDTEGNLSINGTLDAGSDTTIDGDLTVTGDIRTPKLILEGPIAQTDFMDITGEQEDVGIINIPPDKVVVGLAVKRFGNDETPIYSIALRYR